MSGTRILVFGATGMLGHKLVQRLKSPDRLIFAASRRGCDLLSGRGIVSPELCRDGVDALEYGSVKNVVEEISPDVIVNAAGAVKQKEEGRRPFVAIEVNSVFPHRLHETAAGIGARLITISTDCVFSGATGMYTEDSPADAVDLYGRSKVLGEVTDGNTVTIRTSMIGRELGEPHGLLEWMISNRGGKVKGFAEAYFSGFTTIELADVISSHLIDNSSIRGLYHVSADRISKLDLLQIVNEKLGLGIEIEEDRRLRIDRSLDSSRFREATGYVPSSWEAMIEELKEDPTEYR